MTGAGACNPRVGCAVLRTVLVFFAPFLLLGAASLTSVRGQGTLAVHFDQPVYTIPAGGTIPVQVVIDPGPASGLFSYGVSVGFDPSTALLRAIGINVPSDLDFNGVLGPGAFKSYGAGFAAVKGTVSFSAMPLEAYSGKLLATFLFTDRSGVLGSSYQLGLSLFQTLGPGETLFVDGNGNSLDKNLTFGTATVEVVPEPGPIELQVLGVGGWTIWVWRAARTKAKSAGAWS